MAGAHGEAVQRAEQASKAFTSLETQVAGLDDGELGLDSAHEEALETKEAVEAELAALRSEELAATQERAALAARLEALQVGLQRKDASAALLAATDTVAGLLGSVAALLTVGNGFEAAVAAALGTAADAVAVRDVDAAVGVRRPARLADPDDAVVLDDDRRVGEEAEQALVLVRAGAGMLRVVRHEFGDAGDESRRHVCLQKGSMASCRRRPMPPGASVSSRRWRPPRTTSRPSTMTSVTS